MSSKNEKQPQTYEELGQIELLKQELAETRRQLREHAVTDAGKLAVIEAIREVTPARAKVPVARIAKAGGNVTRLSGVIDVGDTHYGELVRASSTGGVAEYSPEIARRRFDYVIDETIRRGKEQGIKNLWMVGGGDMISGDIHDDLSRSNAMMQVEQTLEMAEIMYGGLEKLCQAFPEVNFVGVSGNHARGYRQPFFNRKQTENYDYILYKMLEAKGVNQPNLKFHTPESFWTVFPVEEHSFLTMHGDTNKQQNSMGLSFYSIDKEARKWIGLSDDGLIPHWDSLITHHLHTPAVVPVGAKNVYINGSLKGIDDYSLAMTRPPVPASQRMLTVGGKEIVYDQVIRVDHVK